MFAHFLNLAQVLLPCCDILHEPVYEHKIIGFSIVLVVSVPINTIHEHWRFLDQLKVVGMNSVQVLLSIVTNGVLVGPIPTCFFFLIFIVLLHEWVHFFLLFEGITLVM